MYAWVFNTVLAINDHIIAIDIYIYIYTSTRPLIFMCYISIYLITLLCSFLLSIHLSTIINYSTSIYILPIFSAIHPSTHTSIYPHLTIHQSTILTIHLHLFQSIHPHIHPSIYPSIPPFIHLSIYSSIHPHIHSAI